MAAPDTTPDNVFSFPTAEQEEVEVHEGQARFAQRFTRNYGGQFLHAHDIAWHQWDGHRWVECDDGAPHRAVLALVRDALGEVALMGGTKDAELFLKEIRRIESAGAVAGVLTLAGNEHPCTVAGRALDPNRELLNTPGGTINLETHEVHPPNPADRITKVTNATLDPTAAADGTFHAFLERIQPDPEMRAYLARCLGLALLGKVREHVLFIWFGEGANGKSTLREAVADALGDYAIEVPPEILLQSKYGQQANAPERMRLRGARLAFCSEIEQGAKMDASIMKKLTGGEPVNAKLLYRNPIQFDPSHTLVMQTNYLPQVRGDDPAVWRRIQAAPFDVVVPEAERDAKLPEKLKADRDAVLAWIFAGWLDYQKQGLNPPQAVLDATQQYQKDSDLLSGFLADSSVIYDNGGAVLSGKLYEALKRWCTHEGEELNMSNKALTQAMEKRGYKKKTTARGAEWQGLSLVPDEDEDRRSGAW